MCASRLALKTMHIRRERLRSSSETIWLLEVFRSIESEHAIPDRLIMRSCSEWTVRPATVEALEQ